MVERMSQGTITFLVTLFVYVLLLSSHIQAERCIVHGDGFRYKKELLTSCLHKPNSLAVDRSTGTIYVSFDGRNGKLSLNSSGYSLIEELRGDCYFAIGDKYAVIYASCSTGDRDGSRHGRLYYFDSICQKFLLIREEDDAIQIAYHNDILFYYVWDKGLFMLKGQHLIMIKGFEDYITSFVIDKDSDIIYISDGLFNRKLGSDTPVQYGRMGPLTTVALDKHNVAYACDTNIGSLYTLNKSNATLSKKLDAPNCSALAFDQDNNLIYADMQTNKIFKVIKC